MRSLRPTLTAFNDGVGRARYLFDVVDARAVALGLTARDRETFQTVCLIRLSLAWESFLEESVLKHMCGCDSAGGNRLAASGAYTNQRDAHTMLLRGARYLTWSYDASLRNIDRGLGPGHLWDGHIRGVRQDLLDLYSVRNRIAHRSEYSALEFSNVVRSRMGYVPAGMTPGRFLRSVDGTGASYFEQCANLVEAAAITLAT